jgi:hypothetical protein
LRCQAIIAMKDATQGFVAALTCALAALCAALLVASEALLQMWRAPQAAIGGLRVSKLTWGLLLGPALVCTSITAASSGPALLDFLTKFRDETVLFDGAAQVTFGIPITGVRLGGGARWARRPTSCPKRFLPALAASLPPPSSLHTY